MSDQTEDALLSLVVATFVAGMLFLIDSGPRPIPFIAGLVAINYFFGIRSGRRASSQQAKEEAK